MVRIHISAAVFTLNDDRLSREILTLLNMQLKIRNNFDSQNKEAVVLLKRCKQAAPLCFTQLTTRTDRVIRDMNEAGTSKKVFDRNTNKHLVIRKLAPRTAAIFGEEYVWDMIRKNNSATRRCVPYLSVTEVLNSFLQHSFIVPSTMTVFYEGARFIIFPYYNYNLETAIDKLPTPFPPRHIREIMFQIASGLTCTYDSKGKSEKHELNPTF